MQYRRVLIYTWARKPPTIMLFSVFCCPQHSIYLVLDYLHKCRFASILWKRFIAWQFSQQCYTWALLYKKISTTTMAVTEKKRPCYKHDINTSSTRQASMRCRSMKSIAISIEIHLGFKASALPQLPYITQ